MAASTIFGFEGGGEAGELEWRLPFKWALIPFCKDVVWKLRWGLLGEDDGGEVAVTGVMILFGVARRAGGR